MRYFLLAVDDISVPETLKGALITGGIALFFKMLSSWIKSRADRIKDSEMTREDWRHELADEKKEKTKTAEDRDAWHERFFGCQEDLGKAKVRVAELETKLQSCLESRAELLKKVKNSSSIGDGL